MANPYQSLRQAVREAFVRAPSQHDESFGVPDVRIGSTLRIRLPNGRTVRDTQQLRGTAPTPACEEPTLAQSGPYLLDAVTGEIQPLAAPELHVRWVDEYLPSRDVIETRVSVSTRELARPGITQRTDIARREFFLRHYREQYDELCRRAREVPGEVFHFAVHISTAALWQDVRPRTPVRIPNAYAPLLPPTYASEPWLERERAEKRSMELLYDWLSEAQRKELALEGYFTITGESSGKRYQVHKVYSFGLRELDAAGNVVASYCVVPSGTHALGDTMLAQKIWMETDEEATLKRANRMPVLMTTIYATRMAPNA